MEHSFKDRIPPGKDTNWGIINPFPKIHHATARISTDRPALSYVLYEHGKFVASDAMIIVSVERNLPDTAPKAFAIHRDQYAGLTTLRKNEAIEFDDNGQFVHKVRTVNGQRHVVHSASIDYGMARDYPATYTTVIENARRDIAHDQSSPIGTKDITVNPKVMQRFLRCIGGLRLTFHLISKRKNIYVTSELDDTLEALIMPTYPNESYTPKHLRK